MTWGYPHFRKPPTVYNCHSTVYNRKTCNTSIVAIVLITHFMKHILCCTQYAQHSCDVKTRAKADMDPQFTGFCKLLSKSKAGSSVHACARVWHCSRQGTHVSEVVCKHISASKYLRIEETTLASSSLACDKKISQE